MKKLFFPSAICIMATCFTVSIIKANAQTKEEAAIKKVIEQETSTYFHKNYDGWAKTWAHDSADYVLRAGPNGYQQVIGWNAIAAEYKQDIQNLSVLSEEEIAPFLNKTGYHIYINGNMASVSFKEGNNNPNVETRTLVKQNGDWKILNFTILNNSSYAFQQTINSMKAFAGRWVLDGKATIEPSKGDELNSLKFDLKITPVGLEQLSDATFTHNGKFYTPFTEVEYFIPDYNTNTISYLDIQRNASGQTFTLTGKVTSSQPNSFTVTVMYPNKPTAIQSEYTVTMQDGKWHQIGKRFDRDGKLTATITGNMRRAE